MNHKSWHWFILSLLTSLSSRSKSEWSPESLNVKIEIRKAEYRLRLWQINQIQVHLYIRVSMRCPKSPIINFWAFLVNLTFVLFPRIADPAITKLSGLLRSGDVEVRTDQSEGYILLTNQRPNYCPIAGEDHSRGGHCSCPRVCLWLWRGEFFLNWKKTVSFTFYFWLSVRMYNFKSRKVWSFNNVVLSSVKGFLWVFDTFYKLDLRYYNVKLP